MRTAIVFYSMSGNSEYVAKEIAKNIDADIIRIEPKKAYPNSGAKKFFWGGKSAVMGEAPELNPYEFDASKYDKVILGFPVWASTFAPPIRTFVKENFEVLKDKKVFAFACQGGAGAEKAFLKLSKLLVSRPLDGTLILCDPKDREKPEDIELIKGFCDGMSGR